MNLNFLKKTAEIKNNGVMVNAAFVEGIKTTCMWVDGFLSSASKPND